MRIGHFIPAYRSQLHVQAAYSVVRDMAWARDAGHLLVPFFADMQPVTRARNWAVGFAREHSCDLLLMQDADVWAIGVSALGALYKSMARTEASAAGAMVMCRSRRTMNCEPARPGEIYDGEVGTGLLLVDLRRVSLPEPWFRTEVSADGRGVVVGEDIGFCRAVVAAGGRVVVDGTIPTAHADQEPLVFQPPVAANRAGDDHR